MPVFAWEGRTRSGEVRKGSMEAAAEPEVLARLRDQNVAVTKVHKKSADFKLPFKIPAFRAAINEKELVVFTRQMATMIDAGLPIVQCLDILSSQAERKSFGKILGDVKAQVEQGSTFSEALRKQKGAFSELFINLVAAGEAGGILDRILSRLASYTEKTMKLKGQIKGAMTYPIAILAIAVIVVCALLWKVIPVFQKMFLEMGGGALPAPTRVVINLSQFFQDHVLLIIGTIVGSIMGGGYVLRTKKGRRTFDKIILKTPIFGPLLRKVAVARFCRTLGTLLAAGVAILDALEIVAKTAGNVIIAEAIMYSRAKISEGKNLGEPLMETKVFPSMVVQMIGVGEQTGAMDTMLAKIADFYEDEVDTAVASLTRLMEPLMMVFLGGIVGGLLIAMYMPIFEMAGNIKQG